MIKVKKLISQKIKYAKLDSKPTVCMINLLKEDTN